MIVARAALAVFLWLSASPAVRAEQHEMPEQAPARSRLFAAGPVTGALFLPRTGTPLGAVLLLHDSLGSDSRTAVYVDQFLPAGIAVLDVQQSDGSPAAIAAAARALSQHARVGGGPVALVGFGAGGRLALQVGAPIAAHAVLYPGCDGVAPPAAQAPQHPVALIHGDSDPVNPTATCTELVHRLQAQGYAVRHLVYRNAGYGWDHPIYGFEQRMLLVRPDGGGRIASNPWPELAGMSASQLAGFMRATFLERR